MPVEIKINLLDLDSAENNIEKESIKTANNNAQLMYDSLTNSPILETDPNDGRIAIITISAHLSGTPKLERNYIV